MGTPKDSFLPVGELSLDFGTAIAALKEGRWVRRAGWNGKNMHVYLEDMGVSRMPRADAKGRITYSDNGKVLPHLVLFNAQGERQPGWNASQADMLAEDWEVISYDEMSAPSPLTPAEPTDYKDRVRQECEELNVKADKLAAFIDSDKFEELDERERTLLTQQFNTMVSYIRVLDARIDNF